MTLDSVFLDVSSVFEYGQIYVALSRIKNIENLYITDFDHTKITVNKRIKNFYDQTEFDN